MHEIKYRQKLKPRYVKNGEQFHYWGFIDGFFTGPVGKVLSEIEGDQYTGLKDKNGAEIYRGDIVRHRLGGYNDGGMGNRWVLSVVEWDNENASFENCVDRHYGIEVVGNIYENSELLKEQGA